MSGEFMNTQCKGLVGTRQAWMGIGASSHWFLSSQALCVCCSHTNSISVYYIRIGLETSENELTCCHLPDKGFGIIREFQLPMLSLFQFLWLREKRLYVIFNFVEENCWFLLSAHHPVLVISVFQSKNPAGWWWHFWILSVRAICCTELTLLSEMAAHSLPGGLTSMAWFWVGFITYIAISLGLEL